MEEYIYNKRFGSATVLHTVLDNGMSIFTSHLQSSFVTAQIIFPSGACEDGAYPGTAHYLEHVLMKGPNRDGIHPAILPLLPLGVENNASTNFVKMDFKMFGFAGDFDKFPKALVEISCNPYFTEEQVDRERTVIIQEAMEHLHGDRFDAWLRSRAFPDNKPLHNSVLGSVESIEIIDRKILYGYMDREFDLSRAVFIAAGGISHERHVELVREAVANYPVRADLSVHSARRPYAFTSFDDEYFDSRVDSARLHFVFPLPNDKRVQFLIGLAADLLTRGKSSLLFSKLRNEHRLVYGVDTSVVAHPFNFFEIATQCSVSDVNRVIYYVKEGLEQLCNGVFDRALYDLILRKREMFFVMRDEIVTGDRQVAWIQDMWQEASYEDDDIKALLLTTKLEDVAEAARMYLAPDKFSLARVMPTK